MGGKSEGRIVLACSPGPGLGSVISAATTVLPGLSAWPKPTLPKYHQIAQQLEADIKAGALGQRGNCPACADIAGEHAVSVVTASRALQILRDKRLINTVDRSVGCYLIPPSNQVEERWALCLRVTPPGPGRRRSPTWPRGGFETVAAQQGLALDTTSFTSHNEWTERRLAAAWCVMGGRWACRACSCCRPASTRPAHTPGRTASGRLSRARDVPVVLIERNLRGHNRPLEHEPGLWR